MERRRALYFGLFIAEGIFIALMIVITLALYLSDMINMAQLIYRSACFAIVPAGAGLGAYFFAGRSLSRAFNASALLLLILVAVFAMNTARNNRGSEPIETKPPKEQRAPAPSSDDPTAAVWGDAGTLTTS